MAGSYWLPLSSYDLQLREHGISGQGNNIAFLDEISPQKIRKKFNGLILHDQ
ncbi:MAG: hypothetical protein RR413_04965 [Christensenellaceae bacterium]